MTRQFAENTKVPVQKTRMEIETMLKKHGATRVVTVEGEGIALIAFLLGGRAIKMQVHMPPEPVKAAKFSGARRAWEQDCRRIWRALNLILKAKLESIASKISTVEREFMPDVVMPNGQTVGNMLHEQIESAYQGGPPTLQLTYGGGQ